MSQSQPVPPRAITEVDSQGTVLVTLSGEWKISTPLPGISFKGDKVRIRIENLDSFDSSLPAWIHHHFKNVRQARFRFFTTAFEISG